MKIRSDRSPTLDREEIEIILRLVGDSKPKLKKKLEDSLSVYHMEDALIAKARRKCEE